MARRIYAVLIGGALGLLVCEAALRLLLPAPQEYDVWWPSTHRVLRPDPALVPGIEGEKHFRTSSIGLRGDEPPTGPAFRLVAVGGSTTECLYLDQDEAWPEAAARLVAERAAARVWAGNAGKSGLSTRDHVVQMECLAPLLGALDVDLLVFLVGVNDLAQRLALGDDHAADPDDPDDRAARDEILLRAFGRLPWSEDPRLAPWKRSALYDAFARRARAWRGSPTFLDDRGEALATWRARRASAPHLLAELPDLEAALEEYRANLHAMLDVCRDLDARAVLMTQPALWRDDLAADEARLLWFGGVGDFLAEDGCDYYAAAALREGLDRYNAATRRVARERGVELVDLAELLPAELALFYDDVHLSERGSAAVAAALAEHLLARPPFAVPVAEAGRRR